MLDEIVNNYSKYDKLLHTHILRFIPMINPDGVVIGNARSSMAGVDLNRRWAEPNPVMHPEIYFMKKKMKLTEK